MDPRYDRCRRGRADPRIIESNEFQVPVRFHELAHPCDENRKSTGNGHPYQVPRFEDLLMQTFADRHLTSIERESLERLLIAQAIQITG